MMIMNNEGIRHLMQDKFQVSGTVATAGPVGRHAEAGTDWKLEPQFLTYSRAKGLLPVSIWAGRGWDGMRTLRSLSMGGN
jgi:lipid-binding SYLF domain-containing protein